MSFQNYSIPSELLTAFLNSGTRPGEAPLADRWSDAIRVLAQVQDFLSSPSSDFGRAVLIQTMGLSGEVILDGAELKIQRKPSRPSLKVLREQAKTLGVDIGHLGRKPRAIQKYLDEVASASPKISPDEQTIHVRPAGFKKYGDPVKAVVA